MLRRLPWTLRMSLLPLVQLRLPFRPELFIPRVHLRVRLRPGSSLQNAAACQAPAHNPASIAWSSSSQPSFWWFFWLP